MSTRTHRAKTSGPQPEKSPSSASLEGIFIPRKARGTPISDKNQKPAGVLAGSTLNVPERVRDLKFRDLPGSVRLGHAMERRKAVRLGDLDGASVTELRSIGNCGNTTVAEIVRLIERAAAGEFKTAVDDNVEWSPASFARLVDHLVSGLSAREAQILEMRLSGKKGRPETLAAIGAKFNLTRERVRQLIDKITGQLRKAGSRRLGAYLRQIELNCGKAVRPLTPELFASWLGGKSGRVRFAPGFYAGLSRELNPEIPSWAGTPKTPVREETARAIQTALESLLRVNFKTIALSEAFRKTKALVAGLKVGEFFDAVRQESRFLVRFPQPDRPTVKLVGFRLVDLAYSVLQGNDSALTADEILTRAKRILGTTESQWSPRGLSNVLNRDSRFHLLGPGTFGLRRHFQFPEKSWAKAKSDFEALLKREAHPLSTTDVIGNRRFEWAGVANVYELACILRADERFTDLGQFLFALAGWGIQERELVKNLIPKVLEKAGRPLSQDEIVARLQQFRSVSQHSIPAHNRNHPNTHYYGLGYYGLKSWDQSVLVNIARDSAFIGRFIRRATHPLTFARLCEILNFAPEGTLADELWRTCAALTSVVRLPDEKSGATRLIDRRSRLYWLLC